MEARIVSHEAGRELDALVAEMVMGCERRVSTLLAERMRDPGGACWCGPAPYGGSMGRGGIHSASYLGLGTREVAPYSTSIAAAWEVVEKLRDNGLHVCISSDAVDEEWEVEVWRPEEDNEYGQVMVGTPGYADTAPHAICLAALSAVGASTPTGETE